MAVALISDMHSILSILPKDEGFSQTRFGAIALCVRDFTLHSRFCSGTIVTSGVGGDGFAGITFRPAPKPYWFENRTRAYARHCVKLIRNEGIALAEIHNRPHLLSLIAPKVSCALALHLHNDPQEMRDAKTPAERQALLARCSGIYCVSEFIRDRFLEGINDAAHKVHIVHNGIAIPISLSPKEKCIVFAGRMTEGKGALLLAEALAIALPQLPEWSAVLIGSDRHSPAEHTTPREAAILATLAPVSAQAQMLGFLSHEETLGHFARAAIAVVPSIWQEPFGRTAIEAMAAGCALISSGRGALLEVTGDAALTPDTLTATSLAEAILTLAKNETLRTEYQHKARQRAEQFAIAKCTATLDNARSILFTESARHAA